VSRGKSNACNPLAPRIDKNLGNPVVQKVWVRTLADDRWIRLLSVNNARSARKASLGPIAACVRECKQVCMHEQNVGGAAMVTTQN
jgi:hypothetical protein